MKTSEKTEWIQAQNFEASKAIRLLQSAKKQRVSEYDERLRKLRDYTEVLFVKDVDEQTELFKPSDILSPELSKLIAAPLQGLD